MIALTPATSVHAAWLSALDACATSADGRVQHLVLAVAEPSPVPHPGVLAAVDAVLVRDGHHRVETVANTLFPSALYSDPGFAWSPDLAADEVAQLDLAADDLYSAYELTLPWLRDADPGNAHGTYFSRMITWPGLAAGGYNQLADRIQQIRDKRRSGKHTFNAADIAVEGAGALHDLGGVQIYESQDRRTMGFPCLVHLDLSLLHGRLSVLAVYRHWHLIRKAYGNLLGLAELQHFLAQQTGSAVGELVVHGTVANTEFDKFNKGRVRDLRARVRAELQDIPGASAEEVGPMPGPTTVTVND